MQLVNIILHIANVFVCQRALVYYGD